jgi:rRNA-processing protein FCF1
VLLDTNFLLLPFQRRIDIFEEIHSLLCTHVEFVVLPQILSELHRLIALGSSKERRAAQSALQLIEQYCTRKIPSDNGKTRFDADTALLRYALTTGALVATNDRVLRRKLVKQGSRVIFLRKLAILAIDQ